MNRYRDRWRRGGASLPNFDTIAAARAAAATMADGAAGVVPGGRSDGEDAIFVVSRGLAHWGGQELHPGHVLGYEWVALSTVDASGSGVGSGISLDAEGRPMGDNATDAFHAQADLALQWPTLLEVRVEIEHWEHVPGGSGQPEHDLGIWCRDSAGSGQGLGVLFYGGEWDFDWLFSGAGAYRHYSGLTTGTDLDGATQLRMVMYGHGRGSTDGRLGFRQYFELEHPTNPVPANGLITTYSNVRANVYDDNGLHVSWFSGGPPGSFAQAHARVVSRVAGLRWVESHAHD